MVENITTLEQISEVLETQGYQPRLLPGEAVMLDVGGSDKPFAAVITENSASKAFVITCQLAVLGDIDEEKSAQFMLAALDANTAIRPYAFAVISESDDPALDSPEKWPVVLTSSIPIGDLSQTELIRAVDDLWEALTTGAPILKLGVSN